jgi:hypothetical protein
LQRIEEYTFAGTNLTNLIFPNSIQFLPGSAIAISSLNTVSFWSGQCEFQVHGLFIEDITGRSVVRYFGISSAVVIESRIEVLCERCFFSCESLTSVTFQSNSKLQRIEEFAFQWSGLTTIEVPASVEVLCKSCFSSCKSLTSVTFEMNSKLQRIEEWAFAESGLTTIQVPASVEVLCKSCFSSCKSLTSVAFEMNSRLQRIEENAFTESGLTELLLSNSIHFLSASAIAVSSLNTISFWPGRCDFQVHELFIEDIAGRSLVRYFGRWSAVVIESRIEF